MTFQYCFDGSIKKVNNLSVSSPRTWGCFSSSELFGFWLIVFPTHVGVFPKDITVQTGIHQSSPRTWGCFRLFHEATELVGVFPTHVGVFLETLMPSLSEEESSPRTWGCFRKPFPPCLYKPVFPTHVGVFPASRARARRMRRLPHARGGVSRQERAGRGRRLSSPRTWGCFSPRFGPARTCRVFPTHVGVFPKR